MSRRRYSARLCARRTAPVGRPTTYWTRGLPPVTYGPPDTNESGRRGSNSRPSPRREEASMAARGAPASRPGGRKVAGGSGEAFPVPGLGFTANDMNMPILTTRISPSPEHHQGLPSLACLLCCESRPLRSCLAPLRPLRGKTLTPLVRLREVWMYESKHPSQLGLTACQRNLTFRPASPVEQQFTPAWKARPPKAHVRRPRFWPRLSLRVRQCCCPGADIIDMTSS
jgi:hypothetical protein